MPDEFDSEAGGESNGDEFSAFAGVNPQELQGRELEVYKHFQGAFTKARQKDAAAVREARSQAATAMELARSSRAQPAEAPEKDPVDPFAEHPGRQLYEGDMFDDATKSALDYYVNRRIKEEVGSAYQKAMGEIAPLRDGVHNATRELTRAKVMSLKAEFGDEIVAKHAEDVTKLVEQNPGLSLKKALLLVAEEDVVEYRAEALLRQRNAARNESIFGSTPVQTRQTARSRSSKSRRDGEGDRDHLMRLMRG